MASVHHHTCLSCTHTFLDCHKISLLHSLDCCHSGFSLSQKYQTTLLIILMKILFLHWKNHENIERSYILIIYLHDILGHGHLQ